MTQIFTFVSRHPAAQRLGLALILLLSLSACKKDESPKSEFYVRFEANGQKVEFVQNTYAVYNKSSDLAVLVMTGSSATSNISLQIYQIDTILNGTYTEAPMTGSFLPAVIMGYVDESGTNFNTAGSTANATITLSEFNDNIARGSFSGRLQESGEPDVLITNGEYYLERL